MFIQLFRFHLYIRIFRPGSKGSKGSDDEEITPPDFTTCMFCGAADGAWNEGEWVQ